MMKSAIRVILVCRNERARERVREFLTLSSNYVMGLLTARLSRL